ncbi:MAG: hypothetical protein LBT63_03470 [Holosporaceae bacterium]|jgi:hypothetical protein|nr:hypothetical protein [Holosporaceae bacterium]
MILSLKTQHDVKDCRKTRGDDTYSEKDWREHNGHAREQDTNANANANTNTGRRSKSPSSLRNSSNRQDYKTLNYDDLGFN